jgi:hypothetical protein
MRRTAHLRSDEMGSKTSWIQELADRCAAVGWEVTYAAGGHRRIKTHKGKVFQIASSPGDVHSQKNAERAAARHGLEALEEKMTLQREKERLERIEADRANGVDWEKEEKKIEEHKERTKYGLINGVVVVEVVQAVGGHPRSPAVKVPIQWGEELLMEDESVIYRCSHPVTLNHKEQPCGRQFETTGSLRSHIAWHARQKPTAAEEVAELGQKIGFKSGTQQVEVFDSVVAPEIIFDTEPKKIEMKPVIEPKPGIVAELMQIGEYADVLHDELGRVTDELDEVRRGLNKLRDNIRDAVKRVATDHVDIDELRAKAARYDEIIKITR